MSDDESVSTQQWCGDVHERGKLYRGCPSTAIVLTNLQKLVAPKISISAMSDGTKSPYSPDFHAGVQGFQILGTWQVITKFTRAKKQ